MSKQILANKKYVYSVVVVIALIATAILYYLTKDDIAKYWAVLYIAIALGISRFIMNKKNLTVDEIASLIWHGVFIIAWLAVIFVSNLFIWESVCYMFAVLSVIQSVGFRFLDGDNAVVSLFANDYEAMYATQRYKKIDDEYGNADDLDRPLIKVGVTCYTVNEALAVPGLADKANEAIEYLKNLK